MPSLQPTAPNAAIARRLTAIASDSLRFEGQSVNRFCCPVVAVLAIATTVAQESGRTRFQRVISSKYAGFRILEAGDFESVVRRDVHDGSAGALVVGHFNFDNYEDFAALAIPSATEHFSSGRSSYEFYRGKLITCFGSAAQDGFTCELIDRVITLPHDTLLQRVRPGTYRCRGELGEREVTTTIDSVGQASEKAAAFTLRRRDGRTSTCVTAD